LADRTDRGVIAADRSGATAGLADPDGRAGGGDVQADGGARDPAGAVVVAGINRSGTVVYNLVNLSSAFVWAGAIGWGAYYMGAAIIDAVNAAGIAAWVALGVLIISLVALEVIRRRRRREARASKR